MPVLILRRCEPDDAALLQEISVRSVVESPGSFGQTVAEVRGQEPSWWADLARECALGGPHSAWFLVVEGQPCGMGYGIRSRDGTGRIGHMWVAPEVRRQGHGRRMLQTVLTWAAGWGATEMGLWAPKDEPAALALRRSAGFVPNGREQEHRPGMHILEMIRSM